MASLVIDWVPCGLLAALQATKLFECPWFVGYADTFGMIRMYAASIAFGPVTWPIVVMLYRRDEAAIRALEEELDVLEKARSADFRAAMQASSDLPRQAMI